MEQYKEEFIHFMVEADVLKFGEFTLKSGRKSPFFMNAGAYVTGSQLKRLGQYYAKAIYAKYGDDFDVLFGPAYKGIPLGVVTAIAFIDFYLLVIGARYGSIDEETGISYTEKEYNYAKTKGLPVLVLIKQPSAISESEKDTGNDKYDKMKKLDEFREKVKNDKNTVDFFTDLNSLKYVASPTFRNAVNYVDDNAGWVRYRDIVDIINEEAEGRNKANTELGEHQQKMLDDMKEMFSQFYSRLTDLENNQLTLKEIPTATSEDIKKLFQVEDNTLIIGNPEENKSVVGLDDVGNIPVDSAFLLVYAADGDGQILKIRTLDSPTQIFTSGKQFMADNSKRESARWEEALDRLIEWGWVKAVGYKGEIFELTGTGYSKADWLKNNMAIDTSKEPLDELKEFED